MTRVTLYHHNDNGEQCIVLAVEEGDIRDVVDEVLDMVPDESTIVELTIEPTEV